jgi:hypothetical protein
MIVSDLRMMVPQTTRTGLVQRRTMRQMGNLMLLHCRACLERLKS